MEKASKRTAIKSVLDKLYKKYNHRDLIKPDPLQFVYRYDNPSDREIVALLSADLAYGRVEQIQKSLTNLFERMGKSPYEFVRGFGKAERKKLNGFKHRFNTDQDISDLLMLLRKVLNQYTSIEAFFVQGYNPDDINIIPTLSKFCNSLLDIYACEHSGKTSRGLNYLLVNPANGSACKRLNLFLRWMIRDDDVDTGQWKSIDKAKLIVPIDVHMGRLCKILGFYNRKVVSLSTAVKITECFAEIEPADPVKYDFALSRIGIVENCNGRHRKACKDCELIPLCCQR
ncbi:MAG: TIGR02757 family protein [Sedimentisphaerales bacterium]|nr:TIGR02757 family protein [Sedimentisphaerales bacterium]